MGIIRKITNKLFIRGKKEEDTHLTVYNYETLSYEVVENTFFNREFKYFGNVHKIGTEVDCTFAADCLNAE